MVFRRIALAMWLLSLLAPVADAQNPVPRPVALEQKPVTNVGEEGLLDPESELAEVPLVAVVGCSTNDATIKQFLAKFEVKEQPTFASALVTPLTKEFQIDSTKCTDTTYRVRVEAKLIVTVNRDAPGLRAFPVKTSLVVEEHYQQGGMTDLPAVTTVSNFTVGYLPLVTVAPAAYFQKASPGSNVQFPIDITNLGNALTVVKFNIIPLGKNRLANVTAPPDLELQSRAETGPSAENRKSVTVKAVTPSGDLYTNSIYSFQVETNAGSPDPRGTGHDQSLLTLSVQVQGTGGASPAPSALVPVVVAVLLGILRRPRPSP